MKIQFVMNVTNVNIFMMIIQTVRVQKKFVLNLLKIHIITKINYVVSPWQMEVLPLTNADGSWFTVTVVDAVAVQPFSSVTNTVKFDVTVGETVMAAVFCPEFQLKVVAVVMAVRVTSSPLHIVFCAKMLTTGAGLTRTVAEAVAVQPYVFVAVTV